MPVLFQFEHTFLEVKIAHERKLAHNAYYLKLGKLQVTIFEQVQKKQFIMRHTLFWFYFHDNLPLL